ncbi:MAG: Ig-like domain-containing protein [Candidatus Tectimicrobiota bacterium]
MTKQPHFVHAWALGLALILAPLLVAPGLAQDSTARRAYDMSLQGPGTALQYEDYELTATVKDSQGQPVHGVPVVFSVEADWRSDASVFPRRVMTENGVARVSFQSNMTGIVTVMAQASGASATDDITVTGTGSTIYNDKYKRGR